MRYKQNLYEYLFQALVSQIQSGIFRQGQALPSQKELCSQYNVGITTVRKVLQMLNENGYVSTSRGQLAIVTYKFSAEACISALIGRRDEIADAYRGFGRLMPSMYLEGAKRCGEKEFKIMQEAVDAITCSSATPMLFKQANIFFYTLLTPFDNQLMMDLEVDLENYLHVPYIPFHDLKDPFESTAEYMKSWLQASLDKIRNRQYDAFYNSIVNTFQKSEKKVDDYLEALSVYVPDIPQVKNDIHWFHGKGRSELYARLAMTIMRRVTGGEFDDKKYLPSIPKIMEEYGVMRDTASRTISLLNKLGIVETIDKKGTVLASRGGHELHLKIDFKDKVVQQRLSLFLDALQIMVLTVQSSAKVFKPVTKEWVDNMAFRLHFAQSTQISSMSIQLLMNCCIQLTPYHSLENIYKQLNEMIVWGYYLKSADASLYPDSGYLAAAMEKVLGILHDGTMIGLPEALEKVFSSIYGNVCSVMSRIPETAGLVKKRLWTRFPSN